MYEGNLVICDREQQYARNLLQMFAQNKEVRFHLYLFHTLEELVKFTVEKPISILLIGGMYPPDQRKQIAAEKRFVLTENAQDNLEEGETGICRYQCAEKIWMQIQGKDLETGPMASKPAEEPEAGSETRRKKTVIQCKENEKGELIGVYSPIHRIGKTRFAINLGKELAKKEPVLYLNLEEYSGDGYYFPERMEQTLADLLYYARQEKGNLGLRISMMAGQDEELDYILPMPYIQDLQEVSGEEWLMLFHQILENCIYTKVILDLGDGVNGLFRILEACHTIYTPYIEEGVAHAKMNQYAENLRRTGRESILERTVQKKMNSTFKR